jgi:demethylmenaquinone methyltransferase / 2-methoxy-6-polyprenyl-1,4-benzoquinol methylase
MSSGALHKGDRIREFFSAIASRYDFANHLLSGGLDFIWRKLAARQIRSWGARRILDIATGSGDLALEIRKSCPESLVIGADFCRPMLLEAKRKNLGNLIESDALQLPFRAATFDAVTIAFGLRNMESWQGVLAECARVLAPGGHLLVLDFSIPRGVTRGLYRLYLHQILPRVAALVTREKTAYSYLADSIEAFPQGESMLQIFRDAGFEETSFLPLHTGIVTIYTGKR